MFFWGNGERNSLNCVFRSWLFTLLPIGYHLGEAPIPVTFGPQKVKKEGGGRQEQGGDERAAGSVGLGKQGTKEPSTREPYLHPDHSVDEEQHHDQKGHVGQGLEEAKDFVRR